MENVAPFLQYILIFAFFYHLVKFFINFLSIFLNFEERKRERERENQEILLLVLTYLIRIPLVIRIRDIFPPRKILHYTRLLVKLLARCTHVYA